MAHQDMETESNQVWRDPLPSVVAPVVAHLRRFQPPEDWWGHLRLLNKNWLRQVTRLIYSITVDDEDLDQLAKSLAGHLAHAKSMDIHVPDRCQLSFDETTGLLLDCSRCDYDIRQVLSCARDLENLKIDMEYLSQEALVGIEPLLHLRNLHVYNARDLSLLDSTPNIENLTLTNCRRLCQLDRYEHLKELNISFFSHHRDLPVFEQDEAKGNCVFTKSSCNAMSELVLKTDIFSDLIKIIPISILLESCNNLKVCRLTCSVEPSDAQEILTALPESLECLWAQRAILCDQITEECTKHLQALKSLDVGWGTEILTYKNFEWIASLCSLESLSLKINSVSDYSFAWLKHLPKLHSISLRAIRIGPSAFAQLSLIKSLQKLNLRFYGDHEFERCEEAEKAYSRMFARGVVIKSLV